jgi:uncharacterized protein YggE
VARVNEPRDDRANPIPTITVRGVGNARVRADSVGIALTVSHRADRPDTALQEAAGKAHALEELLMELGIDQERWVTTGLSLEERTEWDDASKREVRRGYVASSRLLVTLPDAGIVGHLLAEATTRAEAAVHGPWWDVAADNPAHDEARRGAMTDARRRAETYADAAGLVLGALLDVVEVGADHPTRTMRLPVAHSGRVLGAGAEMPARAEGLHVFASVDVTYLLASP